eukprot:COSAG04_NODE_2824_length_3532_cov_1.608506_3_plen_86_part_00
MAIAYSDDQRTVGSVATYSCTADHLVLSGGDASRTCGADEAWDGMEPVCQVRFKLPWPRLSRSPLCLDILPSRCPFFSQAQVFIH